MTAIGAGVSLNGLFVEAWQFTWNLKAGIVAADIGKAVTIDAAAPNTVKLCGAADRILGRLETVENRSIEGLLVGTVSMKGSLKVPFKTGETMVIGGAVQGSSAAGSVEPLVVYVDTDGVGDPTVTHAKHDGNNMVVEIIGSTHVILMLL